MLRNKGNASGIPRTFEVKYERIDPSIKMYQNMTEYASIKLNTSLSWEVAARSPIMQALAEASEFLRSEAKDSLIHRANEGDAEAILELAYMYLSGCCMRRMSEEAALNLLDMLTDPSHEAYVGPTVAPELLAKAHSAAAAANMKKLAATCSPQEVERIEDGELEFLPRRAPETRGFGNADSTNGRRLVYLLLAAKHAEESARLGLVSPTVLTVGNKFVQTAGELGIDVSARGGGGPFRRMLDAVAARREATYAEERRRAGKIGARPNAYVCAREGCEVGGVKKMALRACAGKCPADLKPHYCSKECQKADWPRHRPICKPGSTEKSLTIVKSKDAVECIRRALGEGGSENRQRGQEYVVEVPEPGATGRTMKIISSDLSPGELRAIREAGAARALRA